ncbi:KamA family radical SAM protein [Terrisporobacter sp.]
MLKNTELLTNSVTKIQELNKYLSLSKDEEEKLSEILKKYPMSITPYYLSLIDFNDPNDPIRKMCIPSIEETDLSGSFDTSGEGDNTVVTGVQHKYKQTVIVLSTNHCAMYCRHCFRKRLVGLSDEEIAKHFDEMIIYVKEHKQISNVLISGGDSLLNSNLKIEKYLKELCDINHLDFLRFGTRIPVVYPERITINNELKELLKKYCEKKQIYIVTQFNHPREVTKEAIDAVMYLRETGVVIKNQTVLLKGVNDDSETLGELLKKLTSIGVVPYYVFQCRPVTGVKNQFQVPLKRAIDIVEEAKNLQNGQGKCFKYCLSTTRGKIEIIGKTKDDKMVFKYHQAKYEEDSGRIFIEDIDDNQTWIY